MGQTTRIFVNGSPHDVAADPGRSLLRVVRDDLGLTGTKYSCLEGVCGSCSVLVDGEVVRSCITTVGDIAGRSVTTIEGLAADDRLHPAQQGFLEELGFQCGFCTAGQVIAAAGLLGTNAAPDDDAIRTAMDGNVCRCCAYPQILRSVRRGAELARGGAAERLSPVRTSPAVLAAGALPRPARPWDLQKLPEREYFAFLGDGLVVVLTPEAAARHDTWSQNGGAWLHVGEDEIVTAFTGKVDFGQDNRTALSMLVADELRTSLDAVRLVMGDTDVCPYDPGTFGSRSMPDAGTYLHATAAGARQVLLRMAAERWAADPSTLVARDCRIVRPDGESIGYGQLVRGLQRIELADLGEGATAPGAGGVAGTATAKITALDAVTGRLRFGVDVTRPGMLVGAVLRPPSFGATLWSADVSGASAMAGVVAVVEGDFVGVAAPDLDTARAAIGAIDATWNERPQPTESGIVDYLRAHPVEASGWAGAADDATGDLDAALGSAAVRVEATYTAAYLAHVPLETRVAVADWEGGRLTVWTGTQRPFGVRSNLAEAFGLGEEDVRVIVPDTGGGWGGKHTADVAIEAARLARAAGRPVRVRWTREEEMTWAYFRPFAVIDVRAGLGADGSFDAWELTNTNSGSNAIDTPYAVPNRRIRYQPADSPLRIGSYRALAASANTFARESAMDELAAAIGADPLDFRLRHLADDRLATVLRAAAEAAGWARRGRRPDPGVGLGIGCCVEKGSRVATVAEVRVGADRILEVLRLVTAFECGRIVNPENLRNQVEGAAAMGLGGALFEAVHFDNGRILTPTIKEYRVPRMSDIPQIDVVLVDRPDLRSAGAGETPITAIAPAIANAVFAARGTRLRSMPLAPEGVVG